MINPNCRWLWRVVFALAFLGGWFPATQAAQTAMLLLINDVGEILKIDVDEGKVLDKKYGKSMFINHRKTREILIIDTDVDQITKRIQASSEHDEFGVPIVYLRRRSRMLAQEELKPLLEKWDKAVETDKLQEKSKVLMLVARCVPESMRFRGSYVLRYSNPELRERVIALCLKECGKYEALPPDVHSVTNPWNGGEAGAEYMIFLMTMAESTFDPRIYKTELSPIGLEGDLRILYLVTVNPERTLKFLLESKRGHCIGKTGHPDYFYHDDIAWGMSVDRAYSLLSLMCIQSPKVLISHRDRVLTFVAKHVKHFDSLCRVTYRREPVYLKWQDYDVRNGALDVLGLLGTSEDLKIVEDIIRDATQIEPKRLNGGPRDRREQIQQKGIRVIEQIRQRTANTR